MVFDLFKSRRRARLRAQPPPKAWRAILEHNLPVFHRLSAEDQNELLGHMQVFVAEKIFEGAGGLTITDEIDSHLPTPADDDTGSLGGYFSKN